MNLNMSHYLLRWSDHITNYAELFFTLREEEEFVDCSIACEDGVVGAHRLVLAGCSPYLRDLLKRSNNPHPIIFLVNVARSTVLLLMEFIYRGQAHIPYNRLHELVTLGKSMQIKGLSKIQLPQKYSPILPRIPRLHGSPDRTLTEVCDDHDGERDASDNHSLLRNNVHDADSNREDDSLVDSLELDTPIGHDSVEDTQENNNVRYVDYDVVSSTRNEDENTSESGNEDDSESPPQGTEKCSQDVDEILSKSSLKQNSEGTNYVPKPKSKQIRLSEEVVERERRAKRTKPSNGQPNSPRKAKKGRPSKELPQSPKKRMTTPKKSPKKTIQTTVKSPKKTIQTPSKSPKKTGENSNINLDVKGKVEKLKRPALKTKWPSTNFHNSRIEKKLELGAYVSRHGIEASQSYIFQKMGIKMRPQSLVKLKAQYLAHKKKNPPKKGRPPLKK